MANNFFTIYKPTQITVKKSFIDQIPEYFRLVMPHEYLELGIIPTWWEEHIKKYKADNNAEQVQVLSLSQTLQPEELPKDRLSTLEQLKSKQQTKLYSPNSNLDYAYDKLIRKGYSQLAAAGIVGNLFVESGGRIDVHGDKGTSYGLAQWHDTSSGKGRKTNLFRFSGTTAPTLDQLIEFLDHEIKQDSNLYNQLNTAANAESAAETFCRIFERPSKTAFNQSIGKRKNYAKYMFNKNVG